MKISLLAAVLTVALSATAPAWADQSQQRQVPVAGAVPLGVNVTELQSVMQGWSAKHSIIGKTVYNDRNEKIGTVDDLIISPDRTASYSIIGVGGFLNMGTHNVAVPTSQIRMDRDRIVVPGATKEALKQMPEFRYARK